MLPTFNVALPVLARVTDCAVLELVKGWLGKVKLVGVKTATGMGVADPVPVRLAVCWVPGALSLTVRAPLRIPEVVGVNVTLITQLEAGAKLAGQLLICAKSPVTWMMPMFKVAFPLLVRVTDCAALVVPTDWVEKTRVPEFRVAPGPTPIPLKLMMWGDLAASSWMTTDPLRAPAEVGVKVTDKVQLPAAGTLVPQLSDSAKSPLTTIEEIANGELPMLRSKTVCGALIEPMAKLAYVKE
jgi:hypothetical protein